MAIYCGFKTTAKIQEPTFENTKKACHGKTFY